MNGKNVKRLTSEWSDCKAAWDAAFAQGDGQEPVGNVDCGECPNATSGCRGHCMKAPPADHSEDARQMVCKSCGSNNADVPCAYPEGGQPHCLRAAPAPSVSPANHSGGSADMVALAVAIKALEHLAAVPGCGCAFPCRCAGAEWTRAELEGRMDVASEALTEVKRLLASPPAEPASNPHPEYTRGWQDCLEMHVAPVEDAPSASPAALTVPALIQWRTRPTWLEAGKGWTEWEDCTEESAQDKERVPVLHDWQYGVRRLYLAVSRADHSGDSADMVASAPEGFTIKRVEGHGWIIDPPAGSRWIAHEGTPAGDFIAALTACKGENCGSTDGVSHSRECRAEHAAAIAGRNVVKNTEAGQQTITDAQIEHEAGVFGHYNGEMGQWAFDEYQLLEFARSVIGLAVSRADHSGDSADMVALSDEELGALVDDCLKITEGRKHPFKRDSHVWSDMQSVVNLILSRASSSRAEVPMEWKIAPDEEGWSIVSPSGDGCFLFDNDRLHGQTMEGAAIREVFRQLCASLVYPIAAAEAPNAKEELKP